MDIVILITRDNNSGGGEDRISLQDLLEDSGYHGKFSIDLCEETDDDYRLILPIQKIEIVK